MCGISGIVALSSHGQQSLSAIRQANQAMVQRGPDGGGIYAHDWVVLGHRRLSVIDTSCTGSQPMTTPDGRYTIVFNGEIFNHKKLTDQYLSNAGIEPLRSHSDTEVLLLLFALMGEQVFQILEGFFAAAIYDRQRGDLFLVRDRFGKKPLLLYQDEDCLVFGSEMKVLFAAGIPRRVNWSLLPVYLQLNYVPQPYSLVAGVRKLKAGHYLKFTNGVILEQPYYQLALSPAQYQQYSYEGAQKRLVALMEEAVARRLVADVPLGAFLSGGIDSSVVVALASRHVSGLHTFSIGYKDNAFFDETAYARMVASRYQTRHTAFMLDNDDLLEHIGGVLDYIDEPFADSSAIPVYILSQLTRKHITVALSGDGGDEVFAGYNKHSAEWKIRNGGVRNALIQAGAPLWRSLPQSRNNPLTNKFRQLYRFAKGATLSPADRYWQWASIMDGNTSLSLLHPDIRAQVGSGMNAAIRQTFTGDITGEDFNEVLLADMNLVLLSDMLVKVDSMSMANSLEVRSPFLDHHVVDFAFGLPEHYKINGQMKKRVVQDAFRSHLPEAIYNRPKHGFEIPLLKWFRKELWTLIDADLLDDRFVVEQAVFDSAKVRALKKKLHSASPGDSPATIWALLVFQHWWKRYLA
ncbi:asparagine synthase (glutamine-hydrolysing) [Cnuella takakiae]|uniref:asparagine synthase (glutamine-hydrolyzing) n=1 Tax=Cnuella takakiae TaxID=1302690 RepID=A0A1M5DS38_9BACT|nr:asparagine synthase (glutamine-hydrolyzing) [Cnuella takakiae]OLY93888.1 asparagine synthase (glutamine-hydrolyzing) [Cnuella takakiae]SHF69770.1 asparagine synthase (glutamine-hydrolysing) [Cnuella takakiae]